MVSRHHTHETSCQTKEAILNSAADLFAEVGYQGMTIDEVARRADVGKGTVYLYFESKKELAFSIVDRMNDNLREQHRQILKSKGNPEERLQKMLISRVMFRFDAVKGFKEGVDYMLGCLRPALMQRKKSYVDQEAVNFVEILVEGRTLGAFQCDNPLETAHALITATAALLPYSLSPAELGSRQALEHRATVLSSLLVKGLKTQ
ncbi:MAG TPA: TetR/AcrR family transcriptional regulator [Fimbriimonadaceae bacterium]|jgi:AcrR family transcriptional regulator